MELTREMKQEIEVKRPNRFAYLDKHATKELPGTMPWLEKLANAATRNHMSYGQYIAKYGDRIIDKENEK